MNRFFKMKLKLTVLSFLIILHNGGHEDMLFRTNDRLR